MTQRFFSRKKHSEILTLPVVYVKTAAFDVESPHYTAYLERSQPNFLLNGPFVVSEFIGREPENESAIEEELLRKQYPGFDGSIARGPLSSAGGGGGSRGGSRGRGAGGSSRGGVGSAGGGGGLSSADRGGRTAGKGERAARGGGGGKVGLKMRRSKASTSTHGSGSKVSMSTGEKNAGIALTCLPFFSFRKERVHVRVTCDVAKMPRHNFERNVGLLITTLGPLHTISRSSR